MPAVLPVTAAINSYNEHYVMTTHEQLCPKRRNRSALSCS
jgi:hypothetical protein